MSNGRFCNLLSGYRVFCSCYPMLLSPWEGDRLLAVDRIPDIRKTASLKAGDLCMRCICRISGKTVVLLNYESHCS